jgi:hypothetical protein
MTAVRTWADGPLDDLTIVVLKQLARTRGASGGASRAALKPGFDEADTHG